MCAYLHECVCMCVCTQIGTETQRMRDQIRKTEADMGMALLTAEKLKVSV